MYNFLRRRRPRTASKKARNSGLLAHRSVQIEHLEERLVLSASSTIPKLTNDLAHVATMSSTMSLVQQDTPSLVSVLDDAHIDSSLWQWKDDAVGISAVASGEGQALANDLVSLGMESPSVYGSIVSGFLPVSSIGNLLELSSLNYAEPALRPITRIGSATSGGDAAMRTDVVRDFQGVTGKGVNIGVMSDSYDQGPGSAATDISTGELPGTGNPLGYTTPVNVLRDNIVTGSDEGRAMLQIVHDIAPGASLLFSNPAPVSGPTDQASFAAGIRALRDSGADVIVDDLALPQEPFFMDGLVAQAVDEVVADGVSYFSAAGNENNDSYESTFQSSGITESVTTDIARNELWHDFDPGPGVDTRQLISVPAGTTQFVFQWDDPHISAAPASGGAVRDFDIFMYTTGGGVIRGGSTSVIGGNPVETTFVTFAFPGTIELRIGLRSGTNPGGFLKYIMFSSGQAAEIQEYDTNSPTAFGHVNAAGAIGIGAAYYMNTPEFGQDPALIEGGSSVGGIDIRFDTSGNRLSVPEERQAVDIVAPDGGNTTFFGTVDTGQFEGDGFRNFFGTSAAAPHAAAVAALLLEANPHLGPADMERVLEQSAFDMDDPYTTGTQDGYDATTGYGLVDAIGALGLATDTPQLIGLAPADYLLVNDTSDRLDAVAGGVVDVDTGVAGEQVTLRAAVVAANAGGTNAATILVPKGTFQLTLTGTGTDVTGVYGDLDISSGRSVTIVGAGAGGSIIKPSTNERFFDVFGTLDLSNVTLTGADTRSGGASGTVGGAIWVRNGGTLNLGRSAIVGNKAGNNGGGGIYNDGTLKVVNSVIANNEAIGTNNVGGGIKNNASAKLDGTIVANNTGSGSDANLSGTFVSLGNNLITSLPTSSGITSGVMNDFVGSVNYVVTNRFDETNAADNSYALSLREAVALASSQTIWLPSWEHRLTRTTDGDIDFNTTVTIKGTGAGLAVVDASWLGERVFDVGGAATANLNLSRVTLTGGDTSLGVNGVVGGGIWVRSNGTLTLSDSAIVGNHAGTNGGGLYIDGAATINQSVVSNNSAATQAGGIFSNPNTTSINGNIVAHNVAPSNPDVSGNFSSNRANRFTNISSIASLTNDYVGTVDHVVTGVSDTFDASVIANDISVKSIRDAVYISNDEPGAQVVWLPAWDFVLTKERTSLSTAIELDVSQGDIEVEESLVIRGIGTSPLNPPVNKITKVAWRTGAAADAVFDLLGDYNGDGITSSDDGNVTSGDWVVWKNAYTSGVYNRAADGNDNGVIDDLSVEGDQLIWSSHFGNTLTLDLV